jgi:hypothetical protein
MLRLPHGERATACAYAKASTQAAQSVPAAGTPRSGSRASVRVKPRNPSARMEACSAEAMASPSDTPSRYVPASTSPGFRRSAFSAISLNLP